MPHPLDPGTGSEWCRQAGPARYLSGGLLVNARMSPANWTDRASATFICKPSPSSAARWPCLRERLRGRLAAAVGGGIHAIHVSAAQREQRSDLLRCPADQGVNQRTEVYASKFSSRTWPTEYSTVRPPFIQCGTVSPTSRQGHRSTAPTRCQWPSFSWPRTPRQPVSKSDRVQPGRSSRCILVSRLSVGGTVQPAG
jgi:hypothetical protein